MCEGSLSISIAFFLIRSKWKKWAEPKNLTLIWPSDPRPGPGARTSYLSRREHTDQLAHGRQDVRPYPISPLGTVGHKVLSKECTPIIGIECSRQYMASIVGPSMCRRLTHQP